MNAQRIFVDLGPMSLSLPEQGGASACVRIDAQLDDVIRMKSLLGRCPESPHAFAGSMASDDAYSKLGRDGLLVASDADPLRSESLATSADAGIDSLAFELWAALKVSSSSASTAALTRLALRPAVLRDAELGITDCNGVIEFSIWVGNQNDCQWLQPLLSKLARTVSDRLQRRLRVQLFEDSQATTPLAEQVWPPEFAA